MQELPPYNRFILVLTSLYIEKRLGHRSIVGWFLLLDLENFFLAIQKRLFNSSHLLFCSILLECDFLLTFKEKIQFKFLLNACVKVTLFKTNRNSVIFSISFATHRLDVFFFQSWSKAGDGQPRIGSIRKTFHLMENHRRDFVIRKYRCKRILLIQYMVS